MRYLGGLIAAAAVMAPAQVEAADASVGNVESVRSLDVSVQGTIAQHCSMDRIGDMDLGNLDRPNLSATARASLNCNLPFNMTIEAAHGGFAHEVFPQGQGPYAGLLPYQMALSLPVRKPSSTVVRRVFDSRQLIGGQTLSSDGGIAVDGLELSIAVGRPAGEAGLLGGNYSETIRITIAPS
jgi:spore coat protein U-like protein